MLHPSPSRVRLYRLTEARHRATALTGEGAFRYGGRWNPPGFHVIYTARHLSLAALEILVHIGDRRKLRDYLVITLELPDDLITRHVTKLASEALPPDWPERRAVTRALGRAWLEARSSLALRVPSVIIPGEENVLLNPAHPAMAQVKAGDPIPFRFDPRLG